MTTLTAHARALHSCSTAGYASPRPTTSKVTLFHGSPDAWMQHQTQRRNGAATKAHCLPRTMSPRIPACYTPVAAEAAAGAEAWPTLPSTARPAHPACPASFWVRHASQPTPCSSTDNSSSSDNSSIAAPSTPAAADAPCTAFADDVAPVPATQPAAKPWCIPARRLDAPALVQAGCAYDRAAITLTLRDFGATHSCQQPLPAPTSPCTTTIANPSAKPYKVPQRRTWAEQAAAAEAGRPGRPCAWPQLTAGPQRLTAV
ncbi:hypothetical protein ABPG75_005942 [Micractinium tetrahymenae]